MSNWYQNKKIIITGGGGYLGSNLAKSICNKDCEIYLLDIQFNELALQLSVKQNVYLKKIDLTNQEGTASICNQIKPHLIYHFAASLNRSRDFEIFPDSLKANVLMLYNLLMGLKFHNYDDFFLSSTSELYGNVDSPPFFEDLESAPVSPYSLTKVMAEELLETFSKNYNKPYTILRIFNFFGPKQPSSTFIGEMINAYLKDDEFTMSKGEQERDFLFITDLINQINFVTIFAPNNTIYNLCSGKGTSLNEIVETFKTITSKEFKVNKTLPYRDNEIMKIIGANEKLIEAGYTSEHLSLVQALKECLQPLTFNY